jgi:hypothetical protein
MSNLITSRMIYISNQINSSGCSLSKRWAEWGTCNSAWCSWCQTERHLSRERVRDDGIVENKSSIQVTMETFADQTEHNPKSWLKMGLIRTEHLYLGRRSTRGSRITDISNERSSMIRQDSSRIEHHVDFEVVLQSSSAGVRYGTDQVAVSLKRPQLQIRMIKQLRLWFATSDSS